MSDESTHTLHELPRLAEARLRLQFAGQEWLVDRTHPTLRFGRDAANDLVTDDRFASRRHGRIAYRNGSFHLTDTSNNGTLLVRSQGRTHYVHEETILLDGRGGLRLGRVEGSEIAFVIEILETDGTTWRREPEDATVVEARPPGENVFRKEGEYWTLVYDDQVLRLKDAKGLVDLARLLQHPGKEFHALDLAQESPQAAGTDADRARELHDQMHVDDAAGTGPTLDAVAKRAYKQRLTDLREELAEAELFGDLGRTGRAREEIEFIETQLAGALGLGGRDRPTASNAERARVMVTLRIRTILKKIRQGHPSLGAHLEHSINTGRFCSYDPPQPIAWLS